MAIIKEKYFSWKEIYELGDLKRLQMVLDNFPDEKLMQILESKRRNGRNDYPVRPMWNSLLAGIIYQHSSVDSLRRELARNSQLRDLCGFNPFKKKIIPSAAAYSNFLKNLIKHQKEIDEIFKSLVLKLKKKLSGFGEILAGDGKAIHSYSNQKSKKKNKDGRRDLDADKGVKKYYGINEKGTYWEKIKSWFGYKLHLLVDTKYELPIAFEVTQASTNEGKVMRKLISQVEEPILEKCSFALFDKGYDNEKFIKELYDKYGIKPIIDIRNMWKDSDKTKLLEKTQNVVYDYKGNVFCYCMVTGDKKEMTFKGFEKERKTLKYVCPAKAFGIQCKYLKKCPCVSGVRIPLAYNRRIFTPVARPSYKWKKLYNKRTSVERVNGRLDLSFGFENHFIRGIKKMKLRCSLALCVMLTLALARVKEKQEHLLRSLVKIA